MFSFPSCPRGYTRHWFLCRTCGRVSAVDDAAVSVKDRIVRNGCEHEDRETLLPAAAFEILERADSRTTAGKKERARRVRRVIAAATALEVELTKLRGGGIVLESHAVGNARYDLLLPERVTFSGTILYELQEAIRSLRAHGYKENPP